MIKNKVSLVLLLFVCAFATAQNSKWQFGVGASVVRFADEDASYIGDKHSFQAPRLNLTMAINEQLSLDGALSFNTIDIGVITNSAKYLSADLSLRYNFGEAVSSLYPYVFFGVSAVDSERKMTPTLNIGAGTTYWFSERWGANAQLYYKHSAESFESMRSHIQGSLGIVHSFDFGNLFGRGRGRSGACFD